MKIFQFFMQHNLNLMGIKSLFMNKVFNQVKLNTLFCYLLVLYLLSDMFEQATDWL